MSTVVASNASTLPRDVVKSTFRSLCVAIDSPFSNMVSRLGDKEISSLALDPLLYSDAPSFRQDYLIASYLSKYSGLVTNIDTKAVAFANFEICEQTCAISNERLSSKRTSLVDPILHRARRLIAEVLGSFSFEKLCGLERWSPGATFEFPRKRAYLDTKISTCPFTVTASAAPYFIQSIKSDEHWLVMLLKGADRNSFDFAKLVEIVPGCRIETVPKNAKTDRTIGIEPRGNMFLQKAVGTYIRSRLKRVGVDLDDQSINQRLASQAIGACLATLDLKSASDTICSELIYELLPVDWACYLDAIRSKNYVLNSGAPRRFNKFSSMGNGFTFELESLIFWSLTRATLESAEDSGTARRRSERSCAVYGDDIICPQEIAWELTTVLNYCGFEINLSKSFYEGNFYESCGRHFFDGSDVTPIYQKEVLQDEASCIRGYNRLVRYALRDLSSGYCSTVPVFNSALRLFEKVLDRHRTIPFLPFGADGDDGYLLSDEYILLRLKPGYCANRGLRCTVRSNKPVGIPADELALYTYNLRVIHNRPVRNLVKDYRDNCFQDLLLAQPMTTDSSGYFDSRDEHTLMRSDSHRWVSLG